MYISTFNIYFLSIKSDAITFCCYLVCQSVHQHCTHLPSQPAQQSDIGYDVITGAESVFQSHRLYMIRLMQVLSMIYHHLRHHLSVSTLYRQL